MALSNAKTRLIVCRLVVDCARLFHKQYFPGDEFFGSRMEAMYVALCVVIGHIEDKPFTPSKLSAFLGMPRNTVVRKLKQLERYGVVERRGRVYCARLEAFNSPSADRAAATVRQLIVDAGAKLSKMDNEEVEKSSQVQQGEGCSNVAPPTFPPSPPGVVQ